MGFASATGTFTMIEWLALTGLAQTIFILVYILFRVRNWKQTSLAVAYFLVLAAAFSLQFALRLEDYEQTIRLLMWLCWCLSPPLCYLLVLQVVKGADISEPKQFWVLSLVPISLFAGLLLRDIVRVCDGQLICPELFQWLYLLGSVSGGIAMLALWGHRDLFDTLWKARGGREKYWLIIVLIIANVLVVTVNSLRSTGSILGDDADALLIALGLAFVYVTTTTLFRVFPPPVVLNAAARPTIEDLTQEEKLLADQVRKLMEMDKVYHEPTFSRADLARELHTSENTLSRVINAAFGKSFPKLLNDFRVDDAKRMLQNPDIAIQVVAFEVGFNSLASFNRVFREVTGITPTQYRQENAPSVSTAGPTAV